MARFSALLLFSQLLAVARPLVIPEGALMEQAFLSPSVATHHDHGHAHDNANDDTVYVQSPDVEATSRPSRLTSVLMARRLLALSTSGVASTIFPENLPPNSRAPASLAGQSVSLREYIADCDEEITTDEAGNPTLLALNVATTFRNTAAGSNISLSIDWWDHLNDTKPIYPGFPLSPAGLPRVTLFGYVEPFPDPVPSDTREALEKCYLSVHPDARVWLPHRKGSPHASFWARLVVTQVYWIGGFGDVQQIGWLDVDDWKGIRREGSVDGVGDGRGWEDVRLPGEQ